MDGKTLGSVMKRNRTIYNTTSIDVSMSKFLKQPGFTAGRVCPKLAAVVCRCTQVERRIRQITWTLPKDKKGTCRGQTTPAGRCRGQKGFYLLTAAMRSTIRCSASVSVETIRAVRKPTSHYNLDISSAVTSSTLGAPSISTYFILPSFSAKSLK